MKSLHDGYNYMVRLEKGELLVKSLCKFVKDEKIKGAWVNVIGGAEWAEIGFYHLDKQLYDWHKLAKPLEIVALMGNVAWFDDEPVLHLHGTFSDDQMQTYGGHIKEAEVAGTAEIFIHMLQGKKLGRTHDSLTGLNLLDI